MKILLAKLKKDSFAKYAQGEIQEETPALYRIKTPGIGQIIDVLKTEIESCRIEFPPPAFTKLIF